MTGLRVHVLADHGAFDACADPSKWPAGFFNIVTGSYDFPVAHCAVDGVYTNKAPGGVAYRCSFRVTEAAYCIERAMDILAQKLDMDPAELRIKNLVAQASSSPTSRRSAGNTTPATTTPPCRRRWTRSATSKLRDGAEERSRRPSSAARRAT